MKKKSCNVSSYFDTGIRNVSSLWVDTLFSYSYDLPAGASRTTATFTSTGNFTLNHSQSVPNVTANNAQVRITVWKGNTIVKSETVTGDNVTKDDCSFKW